jgi:hypothetical protein
MRDSSYALPHRTHSLNWEWERRRTPSISITSRYHDTTGSDLQRHADTRKGNEPHVNTVIGERPQKHRLTEIEPLQDDTEDKPVIGVNDRFREDTDHTTALQYLNTDCPIGTIEAVGHKSLKVPHRGKGSAS